MPLSGILMMLSSIGMHAYTHNANNKKARQLLESQHNYQKAAIEKKFEHMRQMQEEQARLTIELEEDMHKERMEEIKNEYNNILDQFIFTQALKSWPLNILPSTMKNESFGELIGNNIQTITIHCILTPSNCKNFNTWIYPSLDFLLQAEINNKWNSMTSHPIAYYGNAWTQGNPKFNNLLNSIELLRTKLKQVPCIVITPYFKSQEEINDGENGISFRINTWGMGTTNTDFYTITPPKGLFSKEKEYVEGAKYRDKESNNSELKDITLKEFVPYLESLIGSIADNYFWSMYNIIPSLPQIIKDSEQHSFLKNGIISYYKELFIHEKQELEEGVSLKSSKLDLLIDFLKNTVGILDSSEFNKQLKDLFLSACSLRGLNISDVDNAIKHIKKNDLFLPCDSEFITKFKELYKFEDANMLTTNIKKTKRMEANEYSSKRDNLLSLIEQTLTVDGLDESDKVSFIQTKRQLLENQFNIVLIGEFQGGKSTTFNALCGGREISPRGAMNKTSAICITASNLTDISQKEYAKIFWKNDSELLNLMDSFTGLIQPEELNIHMKDNEPFILSQHFKFTNKNHLKVLKETLIIQLETLRLDTNKEQELREILRIAQLIITFYGDLHIKQLQLQEKFSIEEVSKFAVFPDNWEQKWAKVQSIEDIKNVFTVEEALFVFVGSIQCYIHSKNLAKLGCSITDCPGLFASSWDTSVALTAMSKANAVIYLLNGSKAMGEADERAISRIYQEKALRNKIYFALNSRENNAITKNIHETNLGKLSNLGIQNCPIFPINILLFFLAEIGTNVLNKTLDDYSRSQFFRVAENNGYSSDTLEGIWKKIVRKIGIVTDNDDLFEIQELSIDSIKKIQEASNSEKVLNNIENSIVSQKALSILIDNGALKIKNCLHKVNSRLSHIEREALKSVEQCEIEFKSAENAYKQFKEEIKEVLSTAFPAHLSNQLAQNAYIEITNSKVIDSIATKLSVDIPKAISLKHKKDAVLMNLYDNFVSKNNTGFFAKERDKKKEKIQSILEPIISNIIEAELSINITLWQNMLYNGTHPDYDIYILPQLEKTATTIQKKWDQAVTGNPILNGFTIEKIPLDNPITIPQPETISTGELTKVTGEYAIHDIFKGIVATIVSILTSIIVGVVIDLLFTGGLGIVYAIIGSFSTMFSTMDAFYKEDKKKISTFNDLNKNQKKFYNELYANLGKLFLNNNTRETLIEKLKECPNNIFKKISDYYETQLKNQENKLMETIENKRVNKQKSIEEQNKTASQAKQIRIAQIEPLEKTVNQFIAECIN